MIYCGYVHTFSYSESGGSVSDGFKFDCRNVGKGGKEVAGAKLENHVGPYLYAIDMNFASMRARMMDRALSTFPPALQELMLESTEVVHSAFRVWWGDVG